MLRPILAFLFFVGLVLGASPAVAGVEAENSGVAQAEVLGGATFVTGEGAAYSGAGWVVAMDAMPTWVEESKEAPASHANDMIPDSEAPTEVVALGDANPEKGAVLAMDGASNNDVLVAAQPSVQVISAEASPSRGGSEDRITLMPLIGGASYIGRWRFHTTNDLTLGLVLEAPVSPQISFEAEGSYGRHGITYSNFSHGFDLWGIGGNGKLYLMKGTFRPYVGAGLMGLYYSGMARGPAFPYQYYDHWLGSGQLLAGGDIALSRDVAIGVRGAFLRPLFNQPVTYYNAVASAPGFEEASAINTSMVKLMGTLKVAF